MSRDLQIIQKLLKYDSQLHDTEIDFLKRGYSNIPAANELLQSSPNAFLFAVIFDQGIPAERAWSAPYYIKQRLGHLDISKILELGAKNIVSICTKRPALHRYNYMGSWIWEASKKLWDEYKSNASNIWSLKPSACDVIARLQEFKGIGQKKSNMAALLLLRDLKVPMKNVADIDIAYDVHVRRVLLRTGIAKKDNAKHMVQVVRNLHPEYPARLDGPLWHVGRNWCHAKETECRECILQRLCPKLKNRNVLS